MGAVTIGVDVGQRVDPTAIAVAEAERRQLPHGAPDWHQLVRWLERLPLGTTYPEVGARVKLVVAEVARRVGKAPLLYIDATGVGTPVVDELRLAGVRARLTAVYFTHGDRRTVTEDGEVRLGKAFLVSRLQALLQGGRLHLPRTEEAAALARELLDYEIRVDEAANDRYGAFKVGTHDDLVTALGLAVQAEPREQLPYGWLRHDPAFRAAVLGPERPPEPEPRRPRWPPVAAEDRWER